MKFLSDYTEQPISEALSTYGGFFAFSNEQLAEKRKPGVQYVSLGAGLICPEENSINLLAAITEAHHKGIQQDLQENGKEAIIRRELANHESYYTGDITATVEALNAYGITRDEIYSIYRLGPDHEG